MIRGRCQRASCNTGARRGEALPLQRSVHLECFLLAILLLICTFLLAFPPGPGSPHDMHLCPLRLPRMAAAPFPPYTSRCSYPLRSLACRSFSSCPSILPFYVWQLPSMFIAPPLLDHRSFPCWPSLLPLSPVVPQPLSIGAFPLSLNLYRSFST